MVQRPGSSQEDSEVSHNWSLIQKGPHFRLATFRLRKTADDSKERFGKAIQDLIYSNFYYVYDGLAYRPTTEEVKELIKSTQAALATTNINLFQVISYCPRVMGASPLDDRAREVCNLNSQHDVLQEQCSLGINLDLMNNTFTLKVPQPEKPFTCRGLLLVMNPVYPPPPHTHTPHPLELQRL